MQSIPNLPNIPSFPLWGPGSGGGGIPANGGQITVFYSAGAGTIGINITTTSGGQWKVTYWDGTSQIVNSGNSSTLKSLVPLASKNIIIQPLSPADSIKFLTVNSQSVIAVDFSRLVSMQNISMANNSALTAIDLSHSILMTSCNLNGNDHLTTCILPSSVLNLFLNSCNSLNTDHAFLTQVPNLTDFELQFNGAVSALDLTPVPLLTAFTGHNSAFTTINVTGLNKLTSIQANALSLFTNFIGLSSCIVLSVINIGNSTDITALDVSMLPMINALEIGGCSNLTSVIVDPAVNIHMDFIDMTNCKCSTINISALPALTQFNGAGNLFTSLDLPATVNGFAVNGNLLIHLLTSGYSGYYNSSTQVFANCFNNNLTAAEINAFFTSLGTAQMNAGVDVSGNPGSATCNTSIATSKGWVVLN